MGKKGYISEFMGGGRIVSHGKIADLSKGFKLPSGNPFSVYVRPKYSVSTLDTVLMRGRTRHDSVAVHQCCSAHQDMDSRPPQQEKRPQNEHSVLGSVHQQRQ